MNRPYCRAFGRRRFYGRFVGMILFLCIFGPKLFYAIKAALFFIAITYLPYLFADYREFVLPFL
jgi:hypothetical protein